MRRFILIYLLLSSIIPFNACTSDDQKLEDAKSFIRNHNKLYTGHIRFSIYVFDTTLKIAPLQIAGREDSLWPVQSVRIKEVVKHSDISGFIHGKDTFDIINSNKIIFPVIVSGNAMLDKKINNYIQGSFREYEASYFSSSASAGLDSCMEPMSACGLINMKYTVTYNQKGILSFAIRYEHCGANCWTAYNFYNFNLSNGEVITLQNIINPATYNQAKYILLDQKREAINTFLKQLNDSIQSDNTIPESEREEAYSPLKRTVESCKYELYLNSFQIHKDKLVFYDECFMPTPFRYLGPEYKLTLYYNQHPVYFKKYF